MPNPVICSSVRKLKIGRRRLSGESHCRGLLFLAYISVSAVTAAGGFAFTASHFRKACAARRKVTKALFAPPFGASLRLGMPSLRHCSGGPPPSAIHGRRRLPRHPCRGAPCAIPAFGLWEWGGRSKAKAKATAEADANIKRSQPRFARQLLQSGRALARLQLLMLMHRHLVRPSGGSA
jgi:hypothetical protein